MLYKLLLQYEATNSDFLSCCQLPFVSNGMLVSLQGYWWPCNIYALLEIPRVVLSICPLHSPGQLWSHPSHGPLLFCHLLPPTPCSFPWFCQSFFPPSEDIQCLSSPPVWTFPLSSQGFTILRQATPCRMLYYLLDPPANRIFHL